MFYQQFIKLCTRAGKRPSTVAKELGISKSTISCWKSRGSLPTDIIAQKLANYFGVTTAYLYGLDAQSQLENIEENISDLQAALASSTPDEREEIEASICLLRESYEDIVIANQLINAANKKIPATQSGSGEDEVTDQLLSFLRSATPEEQKEISNYIEFIKSKRGNK